MDYPESETLSDAVRAALTTRNANVYRMIAHSPGMALSFYAVADAMLQRNSMPMDLRELAILRVGHAYSAPYELHHHERFARAVGLGEPAIKAAETGLLDGLSAAEAAVLRWTDRLLAEHTLGGPDRAAALRQFSVGQLADFVLTVGFYQLVCNFLNTFEVSTEGEAF
ncbi:carboxymuconolactone decarboxylase family protein [Nocardia sp. NPDC050712]|uniref:carboxymuconolactone decarboxylase family protein n=1 Tax=Nocardia sp. NPDC050712 TaxID=3155518 RepID=UPI0033C4E65F